MSPSPLRNCETHGEWVDDGTTDICPECLAEQGFTLEHSASRTADRIRAVAPGLLAEERPFVAEIVRTGQVAHDAGQQAGARFLLDGLGVESMTELAELVAYGRRWLHEHRPDR
jgi:hypothetical protein